MNRLLRVSDARLGVRHMTLLLIVAICAVPAQAGLYINEIFFDPGGAGLDTRDEFVELRGTPDMPLDNCYLIFVENEGQIGYTGDAGKIENIFTLGDDPDTTGADPLSVGSNGFLTIRQKGNLYSAPPAGTTDLVNTGSGAGYGSGAGSTVRHSDLGDEGVTENSGSTIMLIRNNGGAGTVPTLGFDLDDGNDGLDHPDGRDGWEIVDAIGVFSESREAGWGRLYAPVNFGPEIEGQPLSPSLGGVYDLEAGGFVFQPRIEPDAAYVGLGYEIEYLARWGDSVGQSPSDWHASNITDNPMSGSTGVPDFRQSGGLHDSTESDARVETNQGVPYGTAVLTLGESNLFYLDGDFDLDGDVDENDYLIWKAGYGYGTGLVPLSDDTALRTDGDTNGDWVVDAADYTRWRDNLGATIGSGSGLSHVNPVPEPSAAVLLLLACCALAAHRRRLATYVPGCLTPIDLFHQGASS